MTPNVRPVSSDDLAVVVLIFSPQRRLISSGPLGPGIDIVGWTGCASVQELTSRPSWGT